MFRRLLLIACCMPQFVLADELEPMISFKKLFERTVALVPLPELRKFGSDMDNTSGGVNALDAGPSLLTSEDSTEILAGQAFDFSQKRGGLAWNFDTTGGGFRFSPHADIVRYQLQGPGQMMSMTVPGVGYGAGLDSNLRLGSDTAAYASASRMQLSDRIASEGLLGLSHQTSRDSRVFIEAKWVGLGHQPGYDNSYNYSDVRVGISRRFDAL